MSNADSQKQRDTDFSVSRNSSPNAIQNSSVPTDRTDKQTLVYSRKAAFIWALLYLTWTAYLVYVIAQVGSY